MIAALGDISGAHFNPAVTVGFYLAKRLPGSAVLPYMSSQIVGALVASFLLHILFPAHESLGATNPAGAFAQSWVLEVILTLVLMFVILSVSAGTTEKGITAGRAIGGVGTLGALLLAPSAVRP